MVEHSPKILACVEKATAFMSCCIKQSLCLVVLCSHYILLYCVVTMSYGIVQSLCLAVVRSYYASLSSTLTI